MYAPSLPIYAANGSSQGLANATVTLSAQFGTITVKTLGVVSSGTSAKASLDGSSIVVRTKVL